MSIHKEFQVHMLNDAGKVAASGIADAFDALLTRLLEINPDASREMSVCRTKLEEASFFAKKAMASQARHT